MGSRLELHNELLPLCPYVYFQPPSNIQMKYPCIVYNKTNVLNLYASDTKHVSKQEYRIMVIDYNPDSDIANQIQNRFLYCEINQYYTVDNLNHTVLSLHY